MQKITFIDNQEWSPIQYKFILALKVAILDVIWKRITTEVETVFKKSPLEMYVSISVKMLRRIQVSHAYSVNDLEG